MIIKKARLLLGSALVIFALSSLCSCDPEVYDGIPYVFVEIDINLNLTDYLDLQRDGGFVYIMGGVKGIIIYRKNVTTYYAFEQNSPVNPSAACAIVEVDMATRS